MSLADSTGIPSHFKKLPSLEYSLNIHVYKSSKLGMRWLESSGSHSGMSYHGSNSSSHESPNYITSDAACSIPRRNYRYP